MLGRELYCCLVLIFLKNNASGYNTTLDNGLEPVERQLLDFKLIHRQPIGVMSTSAGAPLDVRDTVGLNSDVFNNPHFYDSYSSNQQETLPARKAFAKGTGAFGYFEVTNDVTPYTLADCFSHIGKKTPTVARFSLFSQGPGGNDLVRDIRGMAVKFYTKEGNFDLLGINNPVYSHKDPYQWNSITHGLLRNPVHDRFDPTMQADAITHNPGTLWHRIWLASDYALTNGYGMMDSHMIHAYEIYNRHGESFFVRFSFKSQQSKEYLTENAAQALRVNDPEYASRALYNQIALGKYPIWNLDMDIIPKKNLKTLEYNPFDVTGFWRKGTYRTITIGRLVLNKNPDNHFADVEQAAFSVANLVPGITGAPDELFKARMTAYRNAHNHRLGSNSNKVKVNRPIAMKVYSRDGKPPIRDNMMDAPNFYTNSFNGPVAYVNTARPNERLKVLDRASIDLQEAADFYNYYVVTEGARRRLAENVGVPLSRAASFVQKNALKMVYWVDHDLGQRVARAIEEARAARPPTLVPVETCPAVLDLGPVPPRPPSPVHEKPGCDNITRSDLLTDKPYFSVL